MLAMECTDVLIHMDVSCLLLRETTSKCIRTVPAQLSNTFEQNKTNKIHAPRSCVVNKFTVYKVELLQYLKKWAAEVIFPTVHYYF